MTKIIIPTIHRPTSFPRFADNTEVMYTNKKMIRKENHNRTKQQFAIILTSG